MRNSPTTRHSLLVRLRDCGDNQAWAQFVDLYAPLVHAYGRKHGLQDADAADLTQEVLQAIYGAIERFDYDPHRGSFRGWLFTLTRNRLLNFVASRRRHPSGSGDTDVKEMLEQRPRDEPDEAIWNQHYQWRHFLWAAEQIRGSFQPQTWQAFWQTAVENRPAKAVAEGLGISVGTLYVARSRIIARLKQQIEQLTDESGQSNPFCDRG